MLNISNCKGFTAHRSGWSYAINSLKPLHTDSGIFLDDFIERAFSWDYTKALEDNPYGLPYRTPWVGIMHNPQNMPEWFDYTHSPQSILSRPLFQESLKTCKCLITLSEYLAEYLRNEVDVPVISLKHPSCPQVKQWNSSKFFLSDKKTIVQIGYWLRNFNTLPNLQLNNYNKIWLPSDINLVYPYDDFLYRSNKRTQEQHHYRPEQIKILDRVTNRKYDDILSSSITFLDLHDSSANNAIIECVARSTPLVVNRHPAVVEYLGEDYPLYYESHNEAIDKIHDFELIFEAYQHLNSMDKSWLEGSTFVRQMKKKLECYI